MSEVYLFPRLYFLLLPLIGWFILSTESMFSSWLNFDNIWSTLEARSSAISRADRTTSSESLFVFGEDTMAGGVFA